MYAPAHSTRLAYQRAGSGTPVVLLHGLADSGDLWRHQRPALAERHDVVAIDLPGHGASPPISGRTTLADMADAVAAIIEGLSLIRPVVVGLSMGGGVAQALAVARPDLVRALVLVSTSSEFPPATRERFLRRAERAERDGMAAVVEETVPRWFTPEFSAEHPDEVARTRATVLATDPSSFAVASRANAERHLTSRLSSISCPVLFVGGLRDPADPERALQIYRREIPALRWHLLPEASHLVPVEQPEALTTILTTFLADLGEDHQPGGHR